MKIRNVLFPTDFSESAGRSLPYILKMADAFSSEITVLHIQVPYTDDPQYAQYFFFNEDRYAKFVENQLQQILARVGKARRVRTVVASASSPAMGILRHLERHSVDAVVMGTHGRSALGRFFLGTVAEKVARHAHCPVLTVARQRIGYRDNPAFQKILVSTDFSDYSVEAVRQAREFSRKYGAQLQVLYVLTKQIRPHFQRFSSEGFAGHLAKLATLAKESLQKTLKEQGLGDLSSHVVVGEDNLRASEGIVDYAQKSLADLIVMGRHGLTGIENVLLGSTTERVLRTAPCPVLTIHKSQAT